MTTTAHPTQWKLASRYTVWRTVSMTPITDWVNVFRETGGEHAGRFWSEPCPALLLQESTHDELRYVARRADSDVPDLKTVREHHHRGYDDEPPEQQIVFARVLDGRYVDAADEDKTYVESIPYHDWLRRYVDRGRAVPEDTDESPTPAT
jgi:hypothetical protein